LELPKTLSRYCHVILCNKTLEEEEGEKEEEEEEQEEEEEREEETMNYLPHLGGGVVGDLGSGSHLEA
ncbi:hypothetical protein A6R68_07512, partial [Neotoma lepida]